MIAWLAFCLIAICESFQELFSCFSKNEESEESNDSEASVNSISLQSNQSLREARSKMPNNVSFHYLNNKI